jgi:hypothetical protein
MEYITQEKEFETVRYVARDIWKFIVYVEFIKVLEFLNGDGEFHHLVLR